MMTLITRVVSEFNEAFEVKVDLKLQSKLIKEETAELIEATDDAIANMTPETMEHFLKEAADNLYVLGGLIVMSKDADQDALDHLREDIELAQDVAESKHIMDFAFEDFLTDDIMAEAIIRVHQSNMSKLGDNGYPIRREDGKVLKGPNYAPADLSDLAMECFARLVLKSIAANEGQPLAA